MNLTGLVTLPNGTRYAVCTTIQFGYKPSANSTILTVEPQATHTDTPTKTPEQLEEEAKNSGWFWVEPEFSWWYPWFRLHYRLSVNLSQGNPNIDYGWSLLPFGESYNANNVALANVLNYASEGTESDIVVDYMVGVIIQLGTALLLGCTPLSAAIAIAIYAGYSSVNALRFYLASNGNPKAWLIAFICSAISGTAGLALSGINSLSSLLTSVSRFIVGKISSIWHSLIAKALSFFTITGAAFALIDFAFMIFYLSMYFASI